MPYSRARVYIITAPKLCGQTIDVMLLRRLPCVHVTQLRQGKDFLAKHALLLTQLLH